MSVEDVKAFFGKAEGDKGLQARLRALAEKRKAQEKAAVADLIQIASSSGFEFTAADLAEARKAAAGELSVDDLRAVAGGQGSSGCGKGLGWSAGAFFGCQKGLGAY